MTEETNTTVVDENTQIAQRRAKLALLRAQGNPFPNNFRRDSLAAELHEKYGALDNTVLESDPVRVKVAGRMMAKRVMGKASFAQIQDMSGRIQLFVQRDAISVEHYEDGFKKWDVGDILGAEGALFKTKTGELSVRVDTLALLTKALRPLPEKFHGLVDHEIRYRQRYLDLIMNEDVRKVFVIRTPRDQFHPQFFNRACLSGSRDADDACYSRRGDGASFQDASLRARHGHVSAHCA